MNKHKIGCLLYFFLSNSNQLKYGSVLTGLSSQFALKQDQYLRSITHAMSILSDHKFDEAYHEIKKKRKDKLERERNNCKEDGDSIEESELNFSQLEGVCYCCSKKGHKSPQCKDKDKPKSEWLINKTREAAFIQQQVAAASAQSSDSQSVATNPPMPPQPPANSQLTGDRLFNWMATSYSFSQPHEDMKKWVLLDTGSTVNVFCNPNLVKNIRKSNQDLQVHTNAGYFTARYNADLPWSDMKVRFDPE
jgi:hypothetical protein